MSGRLKYQQRSHRSYGLKEAAFRGFAIRAYSSNKIKVQRKSFKERLAAFMAALHLGHRHQDK